MAASQTQTCVVVAYIFIKLGFLLSEVDKSTPMAIRYWYESTTQWNRLESR